MGEGMKELLAWARGVRVVLGALEPVVPLEASLRRWGIELSVIRADVEYHARGIRNVTTSALDRIRAAGEGAESLELGVRVDELNRALEDVRGACRDREELLADIGGKLAEFEGTLKKILDWLAPAIAALRSEHLNEVSARVFKEKVRIAIIAVALYDNACFCEDYS